MLLALLAYSGKGRFVVGPTDLSAMAGEMTKLLASSLSKKVQLELDLPEGLPAVVGDASQLQQVLLNLVTNASDAIGEQAGRIRVATGAEVLDAAAASALRGEDPPGPGTFVFLEVSDTGCGIAPEVQGRIFEPFFSTKETGRGLGLSALLGILRAHRGGFRMDSTPGGGTTFRVYFPGSAAPAGPGMRPLGAGAALPPGLRVLLVDDEEHIRDATRRLLEGMGCEVVPARDGLEAVELAAAGSFSVVLLDLMMPRLDGRQTLGLLREDHPGLPVVLCSGYTAQEIPAGFEGVFLAKPYTLDQLTEALVTALAARV
ncbi:MAG: ATP-binding protein [Opitutae bacterium]